MSADGAHQDICRRLRVIGWQPQGSTALSVWKRVCEGDFPPAQRPRPRYCPRGAVVVAVEPFNGNLPRGFEVLGSLRLSFPIFTAVLGGLATLIPTTSHVEGYFSLMGYRRNSYCSGITNFTIEGVM